MLNQTDGRVARGGSDLRPSVEPLEQRKLMSADLTGAVLPGPGIQIGLLLPAVQKVREAADHTQEIADLRGLPETAQAGLLLPAVQKVREAAGRLDGDKGDDQVPLLLPAVQKVREAAARTEEIADLHDVPETARIGLLLPAVQKVVR